MDKTNAFGFEDYSRKGKAFRLTPEQIQKFKNREESGIVYDYDNLDIPEPGGMIALISDNAESEEEIYWLRITYAEKCKAITLPPNLFREFMNGGGDPNKDVVFLNFDYTD